MVVEYKFYVNEYGGTAIPESAWVRTSLKAEARLQSFTFGRLELGAMQSVRFAICEMAEFIYGYEKQSGKLSENNDGYSVSYDTSHSDTNHLYKIAYSYLGQSGLMDLEV